MHTTRDAAAYGADPGTGQTAVAMISGTRSASEMTHVVEFHQRAGPKAQSIR